MTTIFDKFKLKHLKLAGGDETHRFEAILVMLKPDGTEQPVSHVSNGGRGGSDMHYPIEPITHDFLMKKLGPAVTRGLVKYYRAHPEKCTSFNDEDPVEQTVRLLEGKDQERLVSGYSNLDWLVNELINRRYEERLRRRDRRTSARNAKNSPFKLGQKVIFGRKRGEKTLGKVVKINKKTLGVEILEDRGSKSVVGQVWRVSPALCTPAP